MKLTLTPTAQIVTLIGPTGDTMARVWEGQDEQGVPVHVFIVRVAVHEDQPEAVHRRFASELMECAKPQPLVHVPLGLII